MVFGVSATMMVVVLGAGALALGPRDVPLIAKFLGRATGRAVAHVSAFTRAIERSTSGNELRGIRADVRASRAFERVGGALPLARLRLRALQRCVQRRDLFGQAVGFRLGFL